MPRNEARQQSAAVGADHSRSAEYQAGAPLHPAGPRVRDRADRARDADHQQGGCDRLLGVHARDVGEKRDSQDGPAAAEQPQRDADEHGQADGEPDHDRLARDRICGLGTDELGHDGLGIAGSAAVIGQLGQRHAHRAGVGQ